MKRLAFMLFAALPGLPAAAQTDFRRLTIDEAAELAGKENKMVFVDFYTDWCGPCRTMANTVFPQKKAGDYLNANFVCIKLNAEKEGREAARTYRVNAYPTFIVLDAEKKVRADIKGAMSADELIAKVRTRLNPELSPERMRKRYERGERTPGLIDNYVCSFLEKGNEKEGFRILDGYFNSLTDAQRMLAENYFIFGRYTLDLADPKARFLADHYNEFEAPVRHDAEERVRLLYYGALVPYLSGYMFSEGKYDSVAYEELKKDITAHGFDKTYPYAPLFALVECYAGGDYSRYLDLLAERRGEMDGKDFDLIMLNLGRLFPLSSDEALKKRLAEYVRSVLPGLRPGTIVSAGRFLGTIEGNR